MKASVIVCTHNRSDVLGQALQSLESQTLSVKEFEVLVIDNGSTDRTAGLVEEQIKKTRITFTYVREDRLGLCVARNRGVREAKGEWIAFLDDDAQADPEWLEALIDATAAMPCSCVGGKIVPNWQTSVPAWFSEPLMRYLIVLDYGDTVRQITRMPFFYGTNMAFHCGVFDRLGLFREDLDRVGTVLMGGGDTEMCLRVHRARLPLVYAPRAVVHHLIPESRLTKEFFRRRFYYSGRARAAHTPDPILTKIALVFGLSLGALSLTPLALAANLFGAQRCAMKIERLILVALGYLHHQILAVSASRR